MKASSVLNAVLALALAAGVAGCGKAGGEQIARDMHNKLDRANEAAAQAARSAEQTKDKIAEATADAAAAAGKVTEEAAKEK